VSLWKGSSETFKCLGEVH